MAKIKFFQPRKLGNKRYPKGVCEVPAEHCKGWFYDALVKAGDIAELSDVAAATASGVEDKPSGAKGEAPQPPKAAKK